MTDPTTGAQQASDPTIVGRVSDNASVNNIVKVVFDFANNGFGGPDDQAVTTFDVNGNFSLTAQNLSPGFRQVPVRLIDQAGNTSGAIFSFVIQGSSQSLWQSVGPGSTDTSNQSDLGIAYDSVSGKITGIAIDPRDPTGNTFYISAPNGGVWRTTDGGNDWKALTDNVTDPTGQRVNVPVGALGIGNDGVVYAATGVDDASPTSRTSVGVLRSADDGRTWTVTGGSVFAGARVSKLGVDPTDSNTVYVAVTSWDDPAKASAVFRTTDGGSTWVNVLDPTHMIDPRTGTLGAGAPLASVTDLLVDPFNPGRLIIGLGNIGQAPAAASAGVWKSADGGTTWTKAIGGDKTVGLDNPTTIPDGTAIGRVTLAQGSGRVGDERVVYVLLSQPSIANPHPFDDVATQNNLLGLYKSKNNLLDFTKVMLRENVPDGQGKTRFMDINVLEHEGHTVGALAVDPANPNVVYVGGAFRVGYLGEPPDHSVIRVDTGNMRDTDYIDPRTGRIPNDGDDINKYLTGWDPTNGFHAYKNVANDNNYGWNPDPTRKGEGVYWYDLEQGVINNSFSFESFLPAAVYDIVGDSQGRLLFATAGGLFRGTPLGFDYDFTANGDGIMGRTNPGLATTPTPRGVDFNDLNGNLQINDLTGAGIDPFDPNRLYTSSEEVGTGVTLNGINSWATSGLAGQAANVPNAVALQVASPDPLNPTAPANVYRLWQENRYNNEITRIPEISTDGGLSFTPTDLTNNGGIALSDASPVNPVLVLNPTKYFNSSEGRYFDELLYGDDRVYVTRTSGNAWDAIGGRLSPTGFVSALAISPSASGFYYAGTTDGKFFIRMGSGGFVERSAGLPGLPINGITVHPNQPNTVYVMLKVPVGGGVSVYKTTDGGQTWAPVGGSGLPQIPAYSMAIDPRTNVGDPGERLYVGTDRGVFISQDGGATWRTAGQGMPAVPVVGLTLTQSVETLVATTQGRGVFTLSTDRIGPSVLSVRKTNQPGTLPDVNPVDDPDVDAPFSQFDIQFSEPIDPTSFTAADVVVTGPNGQVIDNATLNLQVVEVIDPLATSQRHDTFRVTFDGSKVSSSGLYKFTIGPNLTDVPGNLMNQDGNLPNGTATDKYTATFLIGGTDLIDFVKDTYANLLTPAGQATRVPTLAELTGTSVTLMDKARLAGLGVVVKELLSTYNPDPSLNGKIGEARQRLVERLFSNGGAAGEIGNLLPSYTLPQSERDFYVNALKKGTRSPESIMIDIIAGTDTTKGAFIQQYFTVKSNSDVPTFLTNVYNDLYKATGVQFSWLPAATQTKQTTQAATPAGRLALVRSLVNGGLVKYFPNGNTNLPLASTDFRSEEVKLAYQQILKRPATAAEVTAGKSLIAKPLAVNSIQGLEWVYWKLLSSQEFFNLQVQNEGLPDDGLHTDRSWVEGVISDRFFRTAVGGEFSTDAERDIYSQKILDRFKVQRAAFVNGIVKGTEYRALQITDYFQMVHARDPGDTELAAAQTSLKNGVTFPALIATRFASAEFFSTNAPVFVGQSASTDTWAKAVVMRLFNLATAPDSSDPRVAGLKTRAGVNSTVTSRKTAATWLLNNNLYRDQLIGDVFTLLLGRAPTSNELLAYEKFLKTHRWENLITDILANGAASATVTAGLPRAYWEEAN
ncbi:MAG: hypothetical protein J2P46_06680 [Zavarzinella sp.]|nr:hypothetical protein [Zavarzinella sp.]